MEDMSKSFPVNGLMPKKETGSLSFLSKYPRFDGRGVVIAILDTGVDPSALGLQTTTESKPKIIDIIDATGAGDVDISTERTLDSERCLTGLTGRKLRVPSYWVNPSGKFYCGMKPLFDLCSAPLKERIKNERKEKLWRPFNDEALVQVQKKLNDFSLSNKSQTSVSSSNSSLSTPPVSDESAVSSNASNDLINSLKKEDLQAQQELIKELDSKVKDVGPVYDVIVWFDGDSWRACVDTSETGELDMCKVLTNYRDSHEYGTFSYLDMLNYTVRIMQNENVLQIVTDSGAHGTHVAGIASGYYPDKPELNGIAPGAQIVSIKIGDNRLNGMETGFALVNACRFIIENNCDLVNYSFGEPVSYANSGPNLYFAQDLIEKFGVILCASAGNNGPGIETADAPGCYGSAAIGVGAYLSNDMMKAEHSMLGNGSSMLFTWSSRGPTLDGSLGVSVCAPGGAFANVPSNTLRGTQLMSGTSMSSPNCCGCLALILSGLKQNNVEFNPFGVKRAIENTAQTVDEVLGSGAGLIQVEKAYEYLINYKENIFQKIHFEIKQTLKSKTFRGIYLKNSDEIKETRDYLVSVEPIFFDNKLKTAFTLDKQVDLNNKDLLESQKEKISFNRKIGLLVDDNDNGNSWVECPNHLFIYNGSKQFAVRIHPNELAEGKCYFTQIKAYDLDDPKMSCLFKIPITVVKPFTFDKKSNNDYQIEFKEITFKQGQIYRHFFRAPHGATHAELTLNYDNSKGNDHTPVFYAQSFTLEHFRSQIDQAKEEGFRLNTSNEFKYLFRVQSNKVVQLTLAKNWSNIGQVLTNYKVKFRGLYPKNSSEIIQLSSRPLRIEIASYLRNEECEAAVHWKHHIQPLRPAENQIENVKQSFGLLKPIFQIVLTYNFHQTKTDEVCCEVPLLSHLLYENEYQSMFWMIFESQTKRFMLAGDSFPVHYKYARSLEKGDYIIKLHVRHEKIEMLEKLKELSLYVRHTISGQINQDMFASHVSLLKANGKKTFTDLVQKNNESSFLLNVIAEDKLPKDSILLLLTIIFLPNVYLIIVIICKGIANGHFLSGELSLFKDSQVSKVDNHRIFYQINNCSSSTASKKSDKSTSKSSKTASAESLTESITPAASTVSATPLSTTNNAITSTVTVTKSKTDEEKLKEALRDAKVAWILKSKEIFESVRNEYENHVPVYLNRITYLQQQVSTSQNETEKNSIYDEIIELSKTAIDKIDQNDLLRYFGMKHHETDENKKDFENQKSWMVDLLCSQGIALIEKNASSKSDDSYASNIMSTSLTNELKIIYRSIQKWIDISDEKASKFLIKFLLSQQLYGKALKILFKQLEEKPNSQSNEKIILNVKTALSYS